METTPISNHVKNMEYVYNAANLEWGVTIVVDPEQSCNMLKKLFDRDTWKYLRIEAEPCVREKDEEHFISFAGYEWTAFYAPNTDEAYNIYYVEGDVSQLEAANVVFLLPSDENKNPDVLICAKRLAQMIDRFNLPGVRFVMLASKNV